MAPKNSKQLKGKDFVTEHLNQFAREIQKYGDVVHELPHPLSAKVRGDMCKQLNQLLADSITLRDMYKKHHWQVAGPTFYQLHLLFDKHFDEQVEIVDTIAERIQLLGGVTIAMGGDVAKQTKIPAPPIGREEVTVQIARLLGAHKIVMQACLDLSDAADKAGDQGTNDLAVSDVLRANELQSWFIGNHLVEMPLTTAE
ncbi:Dps family protein [Granulicella paludicola]|uniref:Dps family protein n=1 Tax=Granulicella paludicola TaxID=474951 RepID=UPI0021DFB9DA|nr:DNA starvation/stationary phase protection protein [Granulicella paludicola]